MRQKIDYGIDLGTTNSAIARMESGEAVIIKSDDNQMDTTPSCVSFTKRKAMFVGLKAKNQVDSEAKSAFRSRLHAQGNGYLEFKRTMGTDRRYESAAMERSFSSEELSAEVLKTLRSYVRDEQVTSIVITVPAMFKQNQIDATQRAAELAGFKYCELLQEPIAASIAYGIKANAVSGYWLVFDLGGGTFDAALMHVEDGIMKVVDTEGNNHLGGKDIDMAIVDELFIPQISRECEIDAIVDDAGSKKLLQDALKTYAEQAKIALSSKPAWECDLEEDFGNDSAGEPMEANLKIALSQYESVCGPIFQKAIDICTGLLQRNNLSGSDLGSVILVGGPTFSQTLRGMLKEQITSRIDTTVDPMTAVTKGAALFASTKTIPSDLQKRDTSKAQLLLKYPETTVETHENLGIRVDRKQSSGTLPSAFAIEVIRSDRGWSSGRLEMDGDSEIVEILLNEGKANQFDIKLFGADGSTIPCEPASITIIQGLKVPNATLPYSVGLEVYDTATGNQGVYAIKGLGKNQSLPAKGKGIYKTAKDIRPGNKNDRFTISLYDILNYGGEGSRAIFNNPYGGWTVNGEQLPAMLPAQSDVELTLTVDASRRPSLSIYIPVLDETIELKFESSIQRAEDASVLLDDVEQAREIITRIRTSENPPDTSALEAGLEEIEKSLSNRGDRDTGDSARDKLKAICIALDKMEASNQWPEIETKLDGAIELLLIRDQRYGNEKSQKLVAEYQKRVREAKGEKDIKVAKQLIDELFAFSWALIQNDIGVWMSWIKEYDQAFETTPWTDKREARRVLNEAKSMIATNPSKQKVEEAVRALWALMPEERRAAAHKASEEILRR